MKSNSFWTKRKIIILIVAVAVILAGVAFFRNGNGKQVAVVKRADVVQTVSATGKIKPNQSVNLSFDKSGRVSGVYAQVGSVVRKGQTIATLDSGETLADLAKARAVLLEEQIKLRETRTTAPISYGDASKNLIAAVKEGFADADNAVRNRTDQFFKNPSTNPRFEITITSGNFVHYFEVPSETALELSNERRKIETILDDWQKRTAAINADNVLDEADKAISDLNYISNFLDDIAAAVNSFTAADFTYETTVSNYKAAISSARGEVSSSISAIVTAKDKLNAAPTLTGQEGEFGDVLTQEAKVRQAEAAVAALETTLRKSTITAPFDGVVTLQDAKVGSTATAGATLASVISQDEMYVEANISEIHIGKISIGNPVSVTFDAFPGESFGGEISYIEPGDIIVDGVVNYKVRVKLVNPDNRIKSGLTTNLQVETAKKESVLAVPVYAVVIENNQSYVNKLVGNSIEKVPVVLGLKGNDGYAEILEGDLKEGDMTQF